MNTFFTSDTHFSHKNILLPEYCNRPFKDPQEMDEMLIKNWNETVNPGDRVFHIGDFSLAWLPVEKYVPRLNGDITLIVGNHDRPHRSFKGKTLEKQLEWFQKYRDAGFADVCQDLHIKGLLAGFEVDWQFYHLPYYDPEDTYKDDPTRLRHQSDRIPDNGITQICGHVHNRWLTKFTPNGTLMVNVGMDAPGAPWSGKFRPASIGEIMRVMQNVNAKRT